jgi:hypothetical protein
MDPSERCHLWIYHRHRLGRLEDVILVDLNFLLR